MQSFHVVRLVALACSGSLFVACSSAPHAPPAPIDAPEVATAAASPELASSLVAVLDPTAPSPPVVATGPLRAEVVPGMERLERVSLLDSLRCGTRAGKPPVCVGDDRSAQVSIEQLQPVKRLESLHGTHCSLLETGKLACSMVNESTARVASVASTSVSDFVIGGHGEVFALSPGGNVVASVARDDGSVRTKILLRGIDDIVAVGGGICGRTLKGGIECTDRDAPMEHASHAVNGVADVVALATGGVARKKDGSLWGFGADERDPFSAVRVQRLDDGGAVAATDFHSDPDPCALTADGAVVCFDWTDRTSFARSSSRRVELPRTAVKLRPIGAPCAELDNGTVACWGERLAELKRLGLRTLQLSPGSIAPRP